MKIDAGDELKIVTSDGIHSIGEIVSLHADNDEKRFEVAVGNKCSGFLRLLKAQSDNEDYDVVIQGVEGIRGVSCAVKRFDRPYGKIGPTVNIVVEG